MKRPTIRQQDGFLNDCARILLLHALHSSDRGPRQTSTLVDLYPSLEGKSMATLDEITKEKQRVGKLDEGLLKVMLLNVRRIRG